MTRLRWNVKGEEGSRYWPSTDEIWIGEGDVEGGYAAASLAHELAHIRERIFTNVNTESPERVFWKELAVWESAFERGLSPDEVGESLMDDSLGDYLAAIEGRYGRDHLQYREASAGYKRFKRKYLHD